MRASSPDVRIKGGSRRLPAVVTLARLEAIEAIRDPAMVVAALLSLGLALREVLGRAVVWQSFSVHASLWMIPIALVAVLISSSSSSSEWQDDSEEFLDSLPLGRSVRALGRAGGAITPVGFSLAVLVASGAGVLGGNPAGRFLWTEFLSAPLVVAITWVAGCFLGGLRRFRAVTSLSLVVYAFAQLLASPDVEIGAAGPSSTDLGRLMLWLPASRFETPLHLLLRPSSERFAYLATVLVVLVLLIAGKAQTDRSSRSRLSMAAALGMLGVGWLGSLVVSATPGVPWWFMADRPVVDWSYLTPRQDCVVGEHAHVYCAYPGFESWIDDWSDVVERSAGLGPERIRGVVQRPSGSSFDGMDPGPGWLVVGFTWDGDWIGAPVHSFALSAAAAGATVGLPTGYEAACDAQGQGRSIVPLLVAATQVDGGIELLGRLVETPGAEQSVDGVPLGRAFIGEEAAKVGLELSYRDPDQVQDIMVSRYDELIDPSTGVGEVAAWFGIITEDQTFTDVPSDLPACE